jgi:putative endonuclease
MYYVYILKSLKRDRYYIGYSEFPERRLQEHNSGKVKSTKPFRPWVKVYVEECVDELCAIRRERDIKSMKSRIYIEGLIAKNQLTR